MRAVARRAAIAAAVAWGAAAVLYAGSGRWSLVLLAAPLAFALGDLLAARRRAQLRSVLETAFRDLISDGDGGARFRGTGAQILSRRERLVGIAPPRLQASWQVRAHDGARYRVLAQVPSADPSTITWQVARLPDNAPA